MRGVAVVWEDPMVGYAARMLDRLGFSVIAAGGSAAVWDPRRQKDRDWYFGNAEKLGTDGLDPGELRGLLEQEAGVFVECWTDAERSWWEEHGVRETAIRARRPDLVWASLTPYGRGFSPKPRPPGFLFAESGYMSICGPKDGAPCTVPGGVGYDWAGAHLVVGVLALLEQVATEGEGGTLDISVVECWAVGEHIVSHASLQGEPLPRHGSQHGSASPGRVFPAADGWAHLMIAPASPGHWERFRDWLADPRFEDERFLTGPLRWENADALAAIVSEHTGRMTREELFAAGKRLGVPIAPVLNLSEFIDSEHERSRLGADVKGHPDLPEWTSKVWISGVASAPTMSPPRAAGPLGSVTILDFTHILSGPYATLLLSYLGARVWKVESPTHPDGFRYRHGRRALEASEPFIDFNRNKYSVLADLKTDEGRAAVSELLPHCDVVMENFREGTLDGLGFDSQTIRKGNPRAGIVRIRGLGAGPWSWLPAYGPTIQALCGVTALWNPEAAEGAPVGTQGSPADYVSGIHAAMACLAAVRQGRATGLGPEIEISMADSLLALLGPWIQEAWQSGALVPAMGNHDPQLGPLAVRATLDHRWVVMSQQDAARLPGPTEGMSAGRLLSWLEEHGVGGALVKDGMDLLADPIFKERQFLVPFQHPHLGAVVYPGSPLRVVGWTPPMERAPFLGEHVAERQEWLRAREALKGGDAAM